MECGLRSEALGRRRGRRRVLLVRRNLVDVGGRLSFGEPKTKGSVAGVGLSGPVVAALEPQRARVDAERAEWDEAYQDHGLVFPLEDGRPTRAEHVRRRLHALADGAGVWRCRVHDLRHLAATLMLMNGVPLPPVSKTLRHSQMSITSDLSGHLTREAAHVAGDGLGATLDATAAQLASERANARDLRPSATTWSRCGPSDRERERGP